MTKVRLEAESPAEVCFTATVTMKLGDWVELRERIRSDKTYVHPLNDLCAAIDDAVYAAKKAFMGASGEDNE